MRMLGIVQLPVVLRFVELLPRLSVSILPLSAFHLGQTGLLCQCALPSSPECCGSGRFLLLAGAWDNGAQPNLKFP